ncbi:MAG: hypothetical protein OJF49_002440 [Ktedonobacterales bacterium]|jgi:hypothetical protein|nr:MAG: hypothetical protein OJF49_002440 [Ktedonobacterales bacterium]
MQPHRIKGQRVISGLPLCMTLLALTLTLVGCGVTSAGSGGAGGSATATSNAALTPGSAALNGCPNTSASGAGLTPPDLTLRHGGIEPQHVTLKTGQTFEIRLEAVIRWGLSARDASAILTPQGPQGWYDASQRECVWRFVAAKAGTAALNFAGGPVCAPRTACPQYARIEQYAITVA